VPVSQSTLSLWLRDICLSLEQRHRLAELKLRGARAGVTAIRESKVRRISSTHQGALREARDRLARGDVNWAIGVILYWGEGAKNKPWAPSQLVAFTNMEPETLRLCRQWLQRYGGVTLADMGYDIFIPMPTSIGPGLDGLGCLTLSQRRSGRISSDQMRQRVENESGMCTLV